MRQLRVCLAAFRKLTRENWCQLRCSAGTVRAGCRCDMFLFAPLTFAPFYSTRASPEQMCFIVPSLPPTSLSISIILFIPSLLLFSPSLLPLPAMIPRGCATQF